MKKFEIKNSKWGNGLFATQDIKKDELIVDWNDGGGEVFRLKSVFDLPPNSAIHAVQFGENEWIDHPEGRYVNHSCDSNCGWCGKSKLVAMRDILKGEELFLDYDSMEDSDWEMPADCECGILDCRKRIKGFRFLDKDKIDKYMRGRYISEWLIEKYKL